MPTCGRSAARGQAVPSLFQVVPRYGSAAQYTRKKREQNGPDRNIQLMTKMRLFLGLLAAIGAFGQANTGELRLVVTDPGGSPVQSTVTLVSEANDYHRIFKANADGRVVAKRLPFGLYAVTADRGGFVSSKNLVDIRSAIPKELKIALSLNAVQTTVNVTNTETLIDPYATSSANRIGSDTIKDRQSAQPGRGVADLVNQEPGWIFEANGILHPRAEEYQVQYVIDGMPLTENRSPAFVADFDPVIFKK